MLGPVGERIEEQHQGERSAHRGDRDGQVQCLPGSPTGVAPSRVDGEHDAGRKKQPILSAMQNLEHVVFAGRERASEIEGQVVHDGIDADGQAQRFQEEKAHGEGRDAAAVGDENQAGEDQRRSHRRDQPRRVRIASDDQRPDRHQDDPRRTREREHAQHGDANRRKPCTRRRRQRPGTQRGHRDRAGVVEGLLHAGRRPEHDLPAGREEEHRQPETRGRYARRCRPHPTRGGDDDQVDHDYTMARPAGERADQAVEHHVAGTMRPERREAGCVEDFAERVIPTAQPGRCERHRFVPVVDLIA